MRKKNSILKTRYLYIYIVFAQFLGSFLVETFLILKIFVSDISKYHATNKSYQGLGIKMWRLKNCWRIYHGLVGKKLNKNTHIMLKPMY